MGSLMGRNSDEKDKDKKQKRTTENEGDSPYLLADEAAAYLRLKPSTLDAMRWRKEGPAFRKHGGLVVYHKKALDAWSDHRVTDPET